MAEAIPPTPPSQWYTKEQLEQLAQERIDKFSPAERQLAEQILGRPLPYIQHRPVIPGQNVFDPSDIRDHYYANFKPDEKFAIRKKPTFQSYEALKGESAPTYNAVKWTYKKDENEPGFGTGMDDLARIILDNKSTVKFNKKLTTREGALYWVNEKNKGRPEGKKWSVVVYDLNQDGVPEVLILDARKDIRYINGFHVGKKNMQVVAAHQKWIEGKYGNPSDIAELRREGKIAPGELGIRYWMENEATALDEANPLGLLKITSADLKASEYKTRPMNPCNMFLKFVTQRPYKEVWDTVAAKFASNPAYAKALRKLASIIPINAELYNHYVANPVYTNLRTQGYSEKQMRKKYPGKAQSRFSEDCAKMVMNLAKTSGFADTVKSYVTARFNDAATMVSANVGSLPKKEHIDLRKPVVSLEEDYITRWVNTPASQ